MDRRSLARAVEGAAVESVDPLEEPLIALDQAGRVQVQAGPEHHLASLEALEQVGAILEAGVGLPERLDRELGEVDPGGGDLGTRSDREPEPPEGGGVGGGCQLEVDVERSATGLDLPVAVEPQA